MPVWTWTFQDADGGSASAVVDQPDHGFSSQADAEMWVGENWRDLLAAGVEQVHLLHAGERVYGPLALRPAE